MQVYTGFLRSCNKVPEAITHMHKLSMSVHAEQIWHLGQLRNNSISNSCCSNSPFITRTITSDCHCISEHVCHVHTLTIMHACNWPHKLCCKNEENQCMCLPKNHNRFILHIPHNIFQKWSTLLPSLVVTAIYNYNAQKIL